MTAHLPAYLQHLAQGLAARRDLGLHRTLQPPAGLDLCSNDYLGWATDPDLAAEVAEAIRFHGTGAGSSPLVHGFSPLQSMAHEALAVCAGRPAALLYSSGFSANSGLLPAIAESTDTFLSDELNHASLVAGMRLSRARALVFPHGDLDALETLLKQPRAGRTFVVVEAVYSMDGDCADLQTICDLADRHGALVVVDEAHSTGLWGARGSGLVEALGLTARVLATVHTGGKALGVGGAWVAAERPLIEHLVNHSRSFIYSTAPVPALTAGLLAVLRRWSQQPQRVVDVHRKSAWLREKLSTVQWLPAPSPAGDSPILPILLGAPSRALAVAQALQNDGFDVRAIRPPTVPDGTSRLRVTVRSPLPDADLAHFADRLIHHVKVST